MIATIANCAMVPPKLMPGVSRNGGVYSGSRATAPNSSAPKTHFWLRDRPSHQVRRPSPGARRRFARASLACDFSLMRSPRRLGPRMLTCRFARKLRSCACLPEALTEYPGRPDQQHQNEEREGDDISPLRAEDGLPVILHDAEQQAAEQGTAQVADAAEHCRRESLDTQQEPAG